MSPTVEDLFLYSSCKMQQDKNNEPIRHEYRKRQHSDSSDDDASSPKSHSPSIDDDRRAHHNELERRRRDHIKDHFMILKDSIPLLDGEKSSRALILKRAVEYITVMQSRLNENQVNIEELRRKNELLEEKLRDREPSRIQAAAPLPISSPLTLPTIQATIPTLPAASPTAANILPPMDPAQLGSLIASSQEAIITLTQSLLGKMQTSQAPSPGARPQPISPPILFPYQSDRQMTVRF